MLVIFGPLAGIGPSRTKLAAAQHCHVGLHNVQLAGIAADQGACIGLADEIELAHSSLKALVCKALALAYFMRSDIGLSARIGPLQHEINRARSPRIGPFHAL